MRVFHRFQERVRKLGMGLRKAILAESKAAKRENPRSGPQSGLGATTGVGQKSRRPEGCGGARPALCCGSGPSPLRGLAPKLRRALAFAALATDPCRISGHTLQRGIHVRMKIMMETSGLLR